MVTGRRKEKLDTTVSLCEAEGATKDRVSYIQGVTKDRETVSLCEAEGGGTKVLYTELYTGKRYHCVK